MASRQEAQTLIFETVAEVAPFIDEVVEAANRERLALGFFPISLFKEQARKGNLFVAVRIYEGPKLAYAGHLMFDARRAHASVLQLHVIPELQGHGIAQRLLGRLKAHLEELGFISIHARVAEDLKQANRFWERNGFYVQSIAPGGKTRDRTILIRSHELTSQQLFERSGITGQNPFGLDISHRTERPIYLLDLNVLFDLGPRRPRRDAAVDLFRAERFGSCELALSAELQEELVRNLAAPGRTDPMLAWATTFITFPVPPKDDKERLLDDLGSIVFPTPATEGAFTPNEQSDLTHLATAIHHRLAGFITSDDAVLAAAPVLDEKYDIDVISPTAFQPAEGF
jgi:GNAT superfamily N-acetyltransferase